LCVCVIHKYTYMYIYSVVCVSDVCITICRSYTFYTYIHAYIHTHTHNSDAAGIFSRVTERDAEPLLTVLHKHAMRLGNELVKFATRRTCLCNAPPDHDDVSAVQGTANPGNVVSNGRENDHNHTSKEQGKGMAKSGNGVPNGRQNGDVHHENNGKGDSHSSARDEHVSTPRGHRHGHVRHHDNGDNVLRVSSELDDMHTSPRRKHMSHDHMYTSPRHARDRTDMIEDIETQKQNHFIQENENMSPERAAATARCRLCGCIHTHMNACVRRFMDLILKDEPGQRRLALRKVVMHQRVDLFMLLVVVVCICLYLGCTCM
jgi:hypothetical protein